jgi:hypothetical protein
MNEMTAEPPWRTILNWGVVIYFLTLPALALIFGLTGIQFTAGTQIAKFLTDFHFSVSALVAAMAGLNTFDRYKASNGQPKKEKKEISVYEPAKD